MDYVLPPFAGLARANACFLVRMAEVAAAEAEEGLRIGNKALFASAGRFGTLHASTVTPFDLSAELEKGRRRIAGQIVRAVEDWQSAWIDALLLPDVPKVTALAA